MPVLEVDSDGHAVESKFLVAAVDDRHDIVRDQSSIQRAAV